MRFVSEPLRPVHGSVEIGGMAAGEPGLPRRFVWRDEEHEIADVLESWKTTGDDMGETYVRRHWHRVRTSGDLVLRIYFQRQARRWWIFSVDEE